MHSCTLAEAQVDPGPSSVCVEKINLFKENNALSKKRKEKTGGESIFCRSVFFLFSDF